MRWIILAVLALGGCSTLGGLSDFNITQNEVDTLRSSYDAAFLTPAAHYRQLGYCKAGTSWSLAKPCADRAVVAKLRAADATVANEFNLVQGMITSGQSSGVSAAFTALESAVTSAESLVTTFGVQ